MGMLNDRWTTPAVQDGSGTANTSLVFHAKQLLALQEQDMPYVVRTSALHRTPGSSEEVIAQHRPDH